jgi:N-acetylglucosamine kinase-like BadF-type ATPase
MNDLWLAVEGGGTKTRLLLATPDGTVVARELAPGGSPLYITSAQYARTLKPRLRRMLRLASRHKGRVRYVGTAGPMDVALVKRLVREAFGRVPVAHLGEADVALAVHGLGHGLACIAGTGASCSIRAKSGQWVGQGGYGPQFGDAGSAYWIGREAVNWAWRSTEGRGPETDLLTAMQQYFDIDDPVALVRNLAPSGHVHPPFVAGFATEVFAAANDGDAVARSVCRSAGRELGNLILETSRRIPLGRRAVPLVVSGGVFHGGGLITTPLRATLRKGGLRYEWHKPILEPAPGILAAMRRRDKGK